jgi:hypothetical protein
LATSEYIKNQTNGCSELESVATVSGWSEGGYAAVPGSLALQQIGVRILGLYTGGAPFSAKTQVNYAYERFAPGAQPPVDLNLLLWKLALPYFGFSMSVENPLFANTGSGQYLLADEYMQGDSTTNALLWVSTPAQLGLGYVAFVPNNVTNVWNPNLRAIYDEADVADGCTGYVSDTTDKLCEAILNMSVMDELSPYQHSNYHPLCGFYYKIRMAWNRTSITEN